MPPTSEPFAPPAPFSRTVFTLLLLSAVVLAVYLTWVRSGFNYDDRVEFIPVAAPASVRDALALFGQPSYPTLPYYRPITKASLLLQKSIWGLDPVPFHVANALLGAAAACCAYALFIVPTLRIPPGLAFLGAALFALHPVASSCVYPPSGGRYSLLSGVFMVGALAAYLRPGRWHYVLAMGLCALALLSKEQAVIVLPLFVLADLLGLTGRSPGRAPVAWLKRYAVPCALLAGYALARLAVFRGMHVELSFFEKPSVIFLTPLYALQTAITPTWELFYEPMRAATWFSPARLAITLAVTGGVAWLIAKQPPPSRKIAVFWAVWFLLGLLPSANIVSQDVTYDERYTFMSLVAVIGAAGLAAGGLWANRARRPAILAAATALLLAAAATTLQRGRYFENDLAFTQQWVRTSPDEYLPHYSHGVALAELGRADDAIAAYRRALTLNPDWPDTHMNLGAIHLQRGESHEVLARFSDYLRLKPNAAKAHYSLGVAHLVLGHFDLARQSFERALALQPNYPEAHHNLAVAHQHLKELPAAIAHYQAALRFDPAKKNSRENLEALLREQAP